MSLHNVIRIALKIYKKEPISSIYENEDNFIVIYGMPDFTITIGSPIICISKTNEKISYLKYTEIFDKLDTYKLIYKVSI